MKDEDAINRKLKGTLAEQLFELLHHEMKCLILKTGHEFLYPNLLDIANLRKYQHHHKVKNIDAERINSQWDEEDKQGNFGGYNPNKSEFLKKIYEGTIKEDIRFKLSQRFRISKIGKNLAKSPDFTIITPAGEILQFEVKYRYDGQLTSQEKNNSLKRDAKPNLFIFMGIEPFIKILIPHLNIDNQEKQCIENYILDEYFKKGKMYPEIDLPEYSIDKYAYKELIYRRPRILRGLS